ncbi:MAG TPA: Maf family protein [Methylotenera sp.]|nr:Maf family protein [Methylotenera sp.]HPH05710.1 Maf family protein [Methylotenera sp.]HPN01081.1 Maf family protein [Methylotenera sp.]
MVTLPLIYLASRSPRRVELLKQMGVDCLIMPADIDESPLANELPAQYVRRLAQEKAQACLSNLTPAQRQHVVLAADTTVALADKILGKPDNDDDARAMLQMLSASEHQVYTAVAVAYAGKIEVALSSTIVSMMPLSNAQIEAYIATGEHRDKAGSYGIQGVAGAWICRIEGSYTGVMGLPVFETAALLRKIGLLII